MTKQDYGILITQPGVDATGAPTLNKTTLNTAYAQLKIDTTNAAGFQTLTMSLVNNPPEPGGAGHVYTLIYKYQHNYTYKPAIETLFNVTTAPPATSYTTPYFLDWTLLAAKTAFDYAALYAVADDTWIYYIIDKWNSGIGMPNLLTGCNIDITTHAFLDGVGV
jgi:hypothetical protein